LPIWLARADTSARSDSYLGEGHRRRVDGRRRHHAGPVFRAINKAVRVWETALSPKVLWEAVRTAAARAGIEKLAPTRPRRTCARLCHLAGGELDQIQFLLGHVSNQTTERYLGCEQKLRIAVNDRLGIEPDAA
jgi:integrase